jgi:hypothetical protein
MATKKALSLSLPPALRAEAEKLAKRERCSVKAVVCTAIERYANARRVPSAAANGASSKRKRARQAAGEHTGLALWDAIQDTVKDVPRKVWKELPRDGAHNHDRYIYTGS